MAIFPAGSCRAFLSDPDKPYLDMPGLPEATVNTIRPFLILFLYLCQIMQ